MGLLIVTNDNFSTLMITATCVFLRTTTENDCQYICVYNKEWNVVSVWISKQVYFTVVKVNRVDIPIFHSRIKHHVRNAVKGCEIELGWWWKWILNSIRWCDMFNYCFFVKNPVKFVYRLAVWSLGDFDSCGRDEIGIHEFKHFCILFNFIGIQYCLYLAFLKVRVVEIWE